MTSSKLLYRVPKNRNFIKKAAFVNARAFVDDPLFVYFFPSIRKRIKHLPYMFRVAVNYGVRYGEVYATSPNMEGVAVWLPPNTTHSSVWGAVVSGGILVPFKMGWIKPMKTYSFIAKRHKELAPFPHWYLSSIAVDPEHQGKGFGSFLLRSMLEKIDKYGVPCYLETQNPKNVPLYEHFDFELIEDAQIPNTPLRNYAMIRK